MTDCSCRIIWVSCTRSNSLPNAAPQDLLPTRRLQVFAFCIEAVYVIAAGMSGLSASSSAVARLRMPSEW